MRAEFWGVGDGSFFDYNTVSKNRHIKYPMLPAKLASKLGNSKLVTIPQKQPGELRLLSADIALMSSKRNKNDATSIFINQLMPTKSGRYANNIVYCEANEGYHTDDEALLIRRLYDEFKCDYIVLDANGKPLPAYAVMRKMKCGRNGKAEMLTRVEGCVQRRSHTQRIGAEALVGNITRPRVRAVWISRQKDMLNLQEANCKSRGIKSPRDNKIDRSRRI